MIDLVVLGAECELPLHKQVLAVCADIRLIPERDCPNPLDPNQVNGLVLLDIDDKPYWLDAALTAGVPVMATHPIQRLDRNNRSEPESQVPLCILSTGRHTQLSKGLVAGPIAAQPTSYYELELEFDSSQYDLRRETVQAQLVLVVCDMLLHAWGPVDELYSRTRNFFHRGPVEDIITVLLRMRNGVEGLLKLIDYPGLELKLRVRTFADGGISDNAVSLAWCAEDLQVFYRNFTACIQGRAQPLLGRDQVVDSYQLLQWMRASARSDSVLSYGDIR